MSHTLVALILGLFIYITLGALATYGYYHDKKNKSEQVPWINYNVPICVFFIFWLLVVILIPTVHGGEVLAEDGMYDED